MARVWNRLRLQLAIWSYTPGSDSPGPTPGPKDRVTEDAVARVTEAGAQRIIE